ncbi:hypothetical protein DES53_102740 [Roseimicrobium gellanilyticum]|uniref:Uncharacterized protein n=1 Tax=Roseimicrobium gellanilyticum TaxID=748857 RepID=A0A366HSW4_9BACT|nr:hypothetical protein [Roseimicrobium gellanilyticum]RBP46349.1 hypothetical protein DES53_102740 [Roseimicrobium gellanilyticum]
MRTDLQPILAEVDLGQVIMVIVFLVAGFINWLYKLWKQKSEDAERSRRLPTTEELENNRRILAEQERGRQPERRHLAPPTPPPFPASGGSGGGGGSLKELFEELKRAAEGATNVGRPIAQESERQPQRPVHRPAPATTPPPLAAPSRSASTPTPAPTRARVEPFPLAPGPKEDAGSHLEAARRAAAAYSGTRQPRRAAHPLTAMLHTSEGYRQAFVLKEVLDTPKGLRQSPWGDLP